MDDSPKNNVPVTTLPVKRRRVHGPQLPGIGTQAANAAVALVRAAKAAMTRQTIRRDPEHAAACLAICRSCDFWIAEKERCGKCGCFAAFKARLATETCPIGKWPVFDISPPGDASRLQGTDL